jgi:hypothetical protein
VTIRNQVDEAALLDSLEWLLEVDGALRVLHQDGKRIVRVSVDQDPQTLIVSKCSVDPTQPLEGLQEVLVSARRQFEQHQRRSQISIVREERP